MIEGFQTVLAASDEERRDLFVGAADGSAQRAEHRKGLLGLLDS